MKQGLPGEYAQLLVAYPYLTFVRCADVARVRVQGLPRRSVV